MTSLAGKTGNIVLKFEAFVLHVQCRSLENAQLVVSTLHFEETTNFVKDQCFVSVFVNIYGFIKFRDWDGQHATHMDLNSQLHNKHKQSNRLMLPFITSLWLPWLYVIGSSVCHLPPTTFSFQKN